VILGKQAMGAYKRQAYKVQDNHLSVLGIFFSFLDDGGQLIYAAAALQHFERQSILQLVAFYSW